MAVGKKVSFDYDGVLTNPKVADVFDRWKATGDKMYIVTARPDAWMAPVYQFAREHGIPRSQVINTSGADKWHTILKLGIDKHVDNNVHQQALIRKNTSAATWSVTDVLKS